MDDMIFRSFPMKKTQIPWLHWLPDLKTDRAEELSWLRCLTQIVRFRVSGFIQRIGSRGFIHRKFHGFLPPNWLGVPVFSLKPKINDSCWKKHTISDQSEMATSVLDVLPSLNGHRTREWKGRWSNWCNFCPESNFKHLQSIAFFCI